MSDKDDNETSGSETPPKKGRPGSLVELGLDDSETVTSGEVDLSTVVVDSKNVPKPEVEVKKSKPEPKPQPQLAGQYTIQEGDTPWSVALEQYGHGPLASELRQKNIDVPWKVGHVLTL